MTACFYDVPVKFEFLSDTKRWRPFSWEGRPSGGWGWPIRRNRHRFNRRRFNRRRFNRRRCILLSTESGRQPSKKQNKSRQKPGYVRKEFAEPWLWSEELVK